MTTRRLAIFVTTAIACTVACGGTGGTPPAAGAPADAAQARPAKNACALIDRGAIETITGQKLEMLHDIQADNRTACELRAAGRPALLVSMTVHWAGGKEMARTNQAAMSMARQFLNDEDVNIEELTGSSQVRGLADKAYYSDVMPSWVLKDDVMIEITSPALGHEQTKAVFFSAAKSALAKLRPGG